METLKNNLVKVAVIILNYNTSKMTSEAIVKLERSFVKLDYLIVIVDNGSEINVFIDLCNLIKDSIFISNYTKTNLLKDINNKKVRKIIIRSKKNLGFSKGNNLGIKFALDNFSPEYILLMNSDIFIEQKGVVEKLIKTIKSYPKEAVGIMPLVWNKFKKPTNPRYQFQIRRVETFWDTLIVHSPILRRIFKRRFSRFIYAKEMPFFGVTKAQVLSGAFMILSSDFLIEIGFLDEGTFLFHEEIILGRKMQEKGVYSLLNAEVCVTHLQGASSNKKNRYFNSLLFLDKIKSQLYYIKKYCYASPVKIILFFIIRFIEGFIYSLFLERKIRSLYIYTKNFIKIFKFAYEHDTNINTEGNKDARY